MDASSTDQKSDNTEGKSPVQQEVIMRAGVQVWPPDVKTLALIVLAILAIGYTLYFTRPILLPITVALILNLLLSPLVRRLKRFHIPTAVSAAVVVLLAFVSVALLATALFNPAKKWVEQVPGSMAELNTKMRSVMEPIEEIDSASKEIEKITRMEDGEDQAVPVQLEQSMLPGMFSMTGSIMMGIFITVGLLYFLLATDDQMLRRIVHAIPTFRGKRTVVEIARDVECNVSLYLITYTPINTGLALAMAAALWLVGVPNPLLWGVMIGLLNFAPYLGPLVGNIIVTVVAVLSFDSLQHAMLVPVVIFIVQNIEGQFVTPAIMGRWMKLSPTLILLSLVFWGWVWGAVGALLAVPMLSIAAIIIDHIREASEEDPCHKAIVVVDAEETITVDGTDRLPKKAAVVSPPGEEPEMHPATTE